MGTTNLLADPPVTPSPGNKGRRRRLLPAVAALIALVAAAVAVGLSREDDGDPGPVITVEDPSPSTTAPTIAPVAPEVQPTTTVAPRPTTTVPKPVMAPEGPRPAGIVYTPQSVWPETLAELDRLQAAVDQGHQPWRNIPAEVARAYLVDRGLASPAMGSLITTSPDSGSITYTAARTGGRVDLQRLLGGSTWYVTGSRSATVGVQVTRDGGAVTAAVQSGFDGTLIARVKRPGGRWSAEQRRQALAGGNWTITLDSGETSSELILQLRHEGAMTGVAEIFLGAGTHGVRYSALDGESRLQVDGLGPLRIGMGLKEAAAATGLSVRYSESTGCATFHVNGTPAGVALTSVEGSQRLDLVSISEPSIATLSGIRVGSTLAEVRRVYGDRLRGSVQDGWGKLVFRPDDRSLDRLGLALLFSEGKVAGMWAGLRTVIASDEVCG